jgi:hypothetical protein
MRRIASHCVVPHSAMRRIAPYGVTEIWELGFRIAATEYQGIAAIYP